MTSQTENAEYEPSRAESPKEDDCIDLLITVECERTQDGEKTIQVSASEHPKNITKCMAVVVKQNTSEVDGKHIVLCDIVVTDKQKKVSIGKDTNTTSLNAKDAEFFINVSKGFSSMAVSESLVFHREAGSSIIVWENAKTASRKNAEDEPKNGGVMTSRFLKDNECFAVNLDTTISKWRNYVAIGVTTQSPLGLNFPKFMVDLKPQSWIMYWDCNKNKYVVTHDGENLIDDYGENHEEPKMGDRFELMRKANRCLHFFVNGRDMGVAASGVPKDVYGLVDLRWNLVQVTINS